MHAKKDSAEVVLARLLAVDLLPMYKLEKSKDIARISNKNRFSLSLDEWTSIKNQRYVGLNLHLNDVTLQSLGMVRIKGTMTAECCLDLIKKRLKDFGLTLQEHIVGMVTDGASVIIKTGRLSSIIHQICHSHGLHLAVCDVLYKKCRNIENTNEAEGYVREL